MRHGYSLKKLNRTSAHRQSLLMNLAIALFKYEQVKTTLVKAKVLRPYAEKLITLARQDNLTNRRKLLGLLGDEAVVQKLLENVAPRFANRAGGYTRIYKVGFRYGDNAPMGLIELVLLDKEAMQKSRKSVTQKAKKEVTEAKKNRINLVLTIRFKKKLARIKLLFVKLVILILKLHEHKNL